MIKFARPMGHVHCVHDVIIMDYGLLTLSDDLSVMIEIFLQELHSCTLYVYSTFELHCCWSVGYDRENFQVFDYIVIIFKFIYLFF